MSPVNVKVQCLATLFIPTGIYAFKRINKIRMGIMIYGLTFASWIAQNLLIPFNNSSMGLYGLVSLLNLGLGIILPMIFIYNWSIEFNKKKKKESPII